MLSSQWDSEVFASRDSLQSKETGFRLLVQEEL